MIYFVVFLSVALRTFASLSQHPKSNQDVPVQIVDEELWSDKPYRNIVLMHYGREISEEVATPIILNTKVDDDDMRTLWKSYQTLMRGRQHMPVLREGMDEVVRILESFILTNWHGDAWHPWAESLKLPMVKVDSKSDLFWSRKPFTLHRANGEEVSQPDGFMPYFFGFLASNPLVGASFMGWVQDLRFTAWAIKFKHSLGLGNYQTTLDELKKVARLYTGEFYFGSIITKEMMDEHVEVVGWMKMSPFFKHPDFSFLWSDKVFLTPTMMRTICYLQPGNPLLSVDRDQLIASAEYPLPLDMALALDFFGDAFELYLSEQAKSILKHTGGVQYESLNILLGSLVKLRSNRPDNCPISVVDLDELIIELMIYHMSTVCTNSRPDNDHVIRSTTEQADINFFNRVIIETMKIGERRLLPAKSKRHAMALSIQKVESDKFTVTILNGGAGSDRHMKSQSSDSRSLYYYQLSLNLQQISAQHYFANADVLSEEIYGASEPSYENVNLEFDTVIGQKRGTCYIKAILYATKWFLREQTGNARYNWWKTWFLQDQINSAAGLLSPIPTTLDSWNALSLHWNLGEKEEAVLASLPVPKHMGEALLIHQVMRLQGEAFQPLNATVKEVMLSELAKIEMPEGLKKAFELRL